MSDKQLQTTITPIYCFNTNGSGLIGGQPQYQYEHKWVSKNEKRYIRKSPIHIFVTK